MRKIIPLGGVWKFIKKNVEITEAEKTEGLEVTLPHTWNNIDGQDGGNDYYRGTCVYLKEFPAPDKEEGQVVYLEFKGVNSSAEVYLNGELAARHDGGYSTFRANVTKLIKENNVLCVKVDNSATEKVYPQTADFTFYGGIYRDVNIIVVDAAHFDLDY